MNRKIRRKIITFVGVILCLVGLIIFVQNPGLESASIFLGAIFSFLLLFGFDRRDNSDQIVVSNTENENRDVNYSLSPEQRTNNTSLQISQSDSLQIDEDIQSSEAPLTISLNSARYLERLQSEVLEQFRLDHYLPLGVEPVSFEDKATIDALKDALDSTFSVSVRELTQPARMLSVETAVNVGRSIALLGEPGMGKTTSLRFLTLKQILNFRSGKSDQLPIWIDLGKWSERDMPAPIFFWNEFSRLFDSENLAFDLFVRWLKDGKLFMILDGLNELPKRERRDVLLNEKAKDYTIKDEIDPRENSLFVCARDTSSKFIVSCRRSEYAHQVNWRDFVILPLDDTGIESFIENHLRDKSKQAKDLLLEQPLLRYILRNPFFLRSLIVLFEQGWGELPTDRFELVQFVCRSAIFRECSRLKMSTEVVEDVLGKLSHDLMRGGIIGSTFMLREGALQDGNALEVAINCGLGANLIRKNPGSKSNPGFRYTHQLIQEALALNYEEANSKNKEFARPSALSTIGGFHANWSFLREAEENYLRALELADPVTSKELYLIICTNLSRVYRFQNRTTQGLKFLESSLHLVERDADTPTKADLYHELGEVYQRRKRYIESERYFQLSLETYLSLGDQEDYAWEIIGGLGGFYAGSKVLRKNEASNLFEKAEGIFTKLDNKYGLARTTLEKAHLSRFYGDMEVAAKLFENAIEKFAELGLKQWRLYSIEYLAINYRDAHKLDLAADWSRRAIEFADEIEDLNVQITVLVYGLAWTASLKGNHEQAMLYIDRAARLGTQLSSESVRQRIYFAGYGVMNWRLRNFKDSAKYFLIYENGLDAELRQYASLLDKAAFAWAHSIGQFSDRNHPHMYATSYLAWLMVLVIETLHRPTNFFGKIFWRLVWRTIH